MGQQVDQRGGQRWLCCSVCSVHGDSRYGQLLSGVSEVDEMMETRIVGFPFKEGDNEEMEVLASKETVWREGFGD